MHLNVFAEFEPQNAKEIDIAFQKDECYSLEVRRREVPKHFILTARVHDKHFL